MEPLLFLLPIRTPLNTLYSLISLKSKTLSMFYWLLLSIIVDFFCLFLFSLLLFSIYLYGVVHCLDTASCWWEVMGKMVLLADPPVLGIYITHCEPTLCHNRKFSGLDLLRPCVQSPSQANLSLLNRETHCSICNYRVSLFAFFFTGGEKKRKTGLAYEALFNLKHMLSWHLLLSLRFSTWQVIFFFWKAKKLFMLYEICVIETMHSIWG